MAERNKKLPLGFLSEFNSDWRANAETCSKSTASAPLIEVLEPRVLFSADPLAAFADPVAGTVDGFVDSDVVLLPQRAGNTIELVFINDDLEDIGTLLSDLQTQRENGRALEVHILDTQSSGVEQISNVLSQVENIGQVHILSHGNDSGLQLGGSWLHHDSPVLYQDQFEAWQPYLAENASLLFYGCDLAANAGGLSFLSTLATITGTQVFASDDATGHNILKADWELEFHTGDGFYESLLTEVAQASWRGELAAPSLGDGSLANINEDIPTYPGDTIANIFSGQFSSSDGSNFSGIAIAGDATTDEGLWEYSTDSVNWYSVGAVTDGAAVALDTSAMLRFVPAANVNGSVPELTIYGIDDSYTGSYSVNNTLAAIDVSDRGGSTPYAVASATVDSHIFSHEDAPILGDGILTDIIVNTNEAVGATVAEIFAGKFSDVDVGSAFGGIAIAADATTTEGVWQFSTDAGANWYSVGSVTTTAALMIDADSSLRFVPATDYTGAIPSLTLYGVDNTGGPYTDGASVVTADVTTRGTSYPYAQDAATVDSTVLANFTANDDDLGAVLSGEILNFDASALTDNDVFRGPQPPTILNTSTPSFGSIGTGGSGYSYGANIGASGIATFNYEAMEGSPDLISQWKLTSDGADDRNQNNGTVTTDDPPGTLVFDGDDYVEIPNFSYPSEFTLTFDFRVNDLDNGDETSLFSQGEWRQSNYLGVWIKDKNESPSRSLIAEIYDSTESGGGYTRFEFDVSDFEEDTKWHNFAIVVQEGTGHSVYIDGDLEFTSTRADGPFTPTGSAYFGAEPISGVPDYFLENHEIKNARLYTGFDLPTIKANVLNEFSTGSALITVRNEETLVTNTNIEVDEGQTVAVTNSYLLTTDIEQGPAALTYEIVVDATYGKLILNDTDLDVGDTFSQQDIDDGNIEFRHAGSETATADVVTLRVDDGAGSSTDFAFTITLKPQDDLAEIDNVEFGSLTYKEGDGAVSVSDTLTISDVDDTQMNQAIVQLSAGYQSGEDQLVLSTSSPVSGSFSSGSGQLAMTGTTDFATWQVALRNIEYRNDSENPTEGPRVVQYLVQDSGGAYVVVASRTIEVSAVNDAPTMGDAILANVEEDLADPPGELVGAIFDSEFADDDGSLSGIAITTDAAATEGVWQYSTDAGSSWNNVGVVSTTSALMIERTSMLRFVPSADFFGSTPDLMVHAVDDSFIGDYSNGSTKEHLDLTNRGGSTPYADAASSLESYISPIGPADLSSGVEVNTDGGNDSYLLANDGGALLGGLSEVTVEAQFELDTVNSRNALFSYNTPAGDILKVLVRSGGEIDIGLLGIDHLSVAVPELVDGERHSVAASWDSNGGYLRIYADGKLVETITGVRSGQTIPAGGTLILGMEQDSPGGGFEDTEVFSGTLYDIRVWNETRTPAEINAHHNQKLFIDLLPVALVANWQMDGVNGASEIVDAVSGNNLTLEHASGIGFTSNSPVTRLSVAEDATAGTIVGSVHGSFPYNGEDLIKDGSFTLSGDTAITNYTSGSTIGGPAGHWLVNSGNVEVVPTWDKSPNGGALIDLTGTTTGSITQAFATEPGKNYQLNFALSGNFNNTDQHIAQVSINDGTLASNQDFIVNKPDNWANNNLLWDNRSLSFVATSNSYSVDFRALTDVVNGGPIISDVSLVEINPGIAAVLAARPGLTYDEQTHKFYETNPALTDWTSAQSNAVANKLNGVSGRLVTIHSEYENSVVRDLAISMGQNPFIGATDQSSEGTWYWHTGSADDELLWSGTSGGSAPNGVYANWKSGEPNNHNGIEDHAVMFRFRGNGEWNDATFGVPFNATIVEWDAGTVMSRVSYSIESDPVSAFAIDSATGEITVVDISGIDYETDPTYDITVRVTDVSGEYYEELVTLFVTDNSAPQITGIESAELDYTENGAPVMISSTLAISDADDSNLVSATVSTAPQRAEDLLQFSDYGSFASSRNAVTGELSVTGNASVADWQDVLRTVTYENISNDPTVGQVLVNFQVNDGDEVSNIGSRSIEIIAVNDAPTLADSTLVSIQEDSINPAGQTVSAIFGPQFTDVDGFFFGVGVINDSTTSEGVWEFSTDSGSVWQSVGPVSENTALMLGSSDMLRFVPAAGFYGTVPPLEVVGVDDSFDNSGSVTVGDRVFDDVSVRGASTAYAADETTVTSTVLAVGPTDLSSGINLNDKGGNDAYLIADDGAGLIGGLGAITIEAQADFNTPAGGFTPLLSYASSANPEALVLAVEEDGTLFAHVNDTRIDSSVALPVDGQRHSIAFSWSSLNGVAAFYIDGKMVHQEIGFKAGELIVNAGVLVVGQDQDGVDNGYDSLQVFQGTYHDLRIWNEARTEAEIAQTYQHKFHTDALPASLIANWQMDELNVDNEVIDVVTGHKLTLSNATGTGFTAGNVDSELTIVEYATNGTVVGTLLPHSSLIIEDLVDDGSFTVAGVNTATLYSIGENVGVGSPWIVDNGNVQLQGDWAPSPLGGVPLHLSGFVPGTVSQTLATEAGQVYQLNFALTGEFSELTDKTVKVTAGSDTANFSVSRPDGWNAGNALMWDHRSLTFTATSSSTTLTFAATAPASGYGPVIGDVQVVKEPAKVSALLAGDADLQYNASTGKFYKSVPTPVNFTQAREGALASELNGVAGQLVTIRSAFENDLVHNMGLSLGSSLWLGASDVWLEEHWHWLAADQQGEQFWDGAVSGSSVGGVYTNWGVTEPNNSHASGEHHMALRSDDATWNDVNGSTTYQYIIEWNADQVLASHEYVLKSDPSGAFSVDPSSGVISVIDGGLLDYETTSSHDLSIRVTDASGETHDDLVTVHVTDAPAPILLDVASGALAYTENASPLLIAEFIDVIDTDDTELQSATIKIVSGFQTSEDALVFTNTAKLTGVWDSSTGALTITGSDTVTAWQTALRSVGYVNTSNDPVAGNRGIEFIVSDENESSNLIARTVSVSAVNDSPVIFDSTLSSISEDSSTHSGDRVADLFATTMNDIDGTVIAIAITADATTSQGQWQYSTDGGANWYSRGSVSEANALVLDRNANLRFVPATNYSGVVPDLTVFAIDDSSGTAATAGAARVTIDVTVRGGNTAFSADSAVISGDVLGVNDSPSLTVGPIVLLKAGIHVLDNTNVAAVDADVNDTQRIIRVSSVPASGALHLSGAPLNSGDTFSQAQVDAGALRYIHHGLSSVNDAFALTFADAGDNASALSVSRIITVSVTETHPQGVSDTASVDENLSVSIPVLGNDRAADEPLDPFSVSVISPAAHGATTVNDSGVIHYSHFGTETTADSFRYTVSDSGGDISDPVTVSLTINPVNDVPVMNSFIGPASQTPEDTSVEITALELASQISHSDAEDGSLNHFRVTSLNSGSLMIGLDQAGATAFSPGSNDELTGSLKAYWTPDDHVNGIQDAFSIGGIDSDDAPSVFSVAVDVDVLPVNDVPVLSGYPVTDIPYIHRSPAVTLAPTLEISDIDDLQLTAVSIRLLNYEAGVDLLSIQPGTLTSNWDNTTGVLTLSGTDNMAVYQNVLRTLAYESDGPPTGGALTSRSIEITATDNSGGSSTGVPISVSLQIPPFPITVTDPATGTQSFVEDSVSLEFIDGLVVHSVDSRNITGATLRIDNYYASNDTLLFTDTADVTGEWNASNATLTLNGDSSAAVWQNALRTVSYLNVSGNPETETRSIVLTLMSSSGQSDPLSVPVQVIAVNDAPIAVGSSVEFASDTTHTFAITDFGFSDPVENHDLLAVRIEQLPADGQLLNRESTLAAGDEVLATEIDAGVLRYVPYPTSTTNVRTVEFTVLDSGGTANGGIEQSQTNAVVELTITPGEIPESGNESRLPFEVNENTATGAVIGNLAELDQDDAFIHQRGGDFAGATRSEADYNRFAANGGLLGSTLDQWQVTSGNVDLRGPAWANGPDGGIALDMNGSSPGQITQQISTVPGVQYRISFHLGGNFLELQPDGKVRLEVSAAGQQNNFEAEHQTDWSKTNLHWREESMIFTAVDPTTDISFRSLTPGHYGAMIADIEVIDVLQYTMLDSNLPFTVSDNDLSVNGELDHESADTYNVAVVAVNSVGDTAVMTVPVDVIDLNESPQLVNNEVTALVVGETIVIDTGYLSANDVDEADANGDSIHYTLTGLPAAGVLLLANTPLEPGDSFTQTDLEQGRLSYQHSGTEAAADTIEFSLIDGGEDGAPGSNETLTIDIHNPLSVSVAEEFSLMEGGMMTLSGEHIGRSGGLIDNNNVLFEVTGLTEAFSLQNADSGSSVNTFSFHELVNGNVVLLHDGTEQHSGELQLVLSRVDDGITSLIDSREIQLNVSDVADAPVGKDSTLATDHATPVTITTQQLGFDDHNDGDSFSGMVIVSVPVVGTLQAGGEVVAEGDTIDALVIDAGELQYIPDPLTTGMLHEAISFRLLDTGDLSNGGARLSENLYLIDITVESNHVPRAQADTAVVEEGGTVSSLATGAQSVIDNDIDLDTPPDELLVELVGEPLHGALQLKRDGTFVYLHDGSETLSDTFSYRVVDNESELGQMLGSIGLVEIEISPSNDAPEAGETDDLQVIANAPLQIELPNDLFVDFDIVDELTLTATLVDGSELPSWLLFNPTAAQFTGAPGNNQAGTYQIVVTATDSAGASADSEFEIVVEPEIGAAFSQAIDPTAIFNNSVPAAPAASPSANTLTTGSVETDSAVEEKHNRSSSVPEDEALLFESAAPDDLISEHRFEDEVVKYIQRRTETAAEPIVVQHNAIENSQVTELQQLFFVEGDNPLKLAKAIQQEMNRVKGDLTKSAAQESLTIGGTMGLSAGLSIGYVIWLVRGGMLLGSVMASMPAWRWIDPVPVLEEINQDSDDSDHETLETIANSSVEDATDDRNSEDSDSCEGVAKRGSQPDKGS